jgi:malonyl-CoA O-methyltransferase
MSLRPDFDPQAALRHERRLTQQTERPWLHTEVARRMSERLAIIRQTPQEVLVWDSLERRSPELRASYPKARIRRFGLEQGLIGPSGSTAGALKDTLQDAWQRVQRWTRQQGAPTSVLTREELTPGGFDLLWSNLWLHRCGDFQSALSAWQACLKVEGFVMFSFLGPGTLQALSGLYRDRHWGEAMAPLVDMHDVGDMLVEAGFADPVMDQEALTLTWPDANAALTELRGLGGNGSAGRFAGLRTPRWRQALMDSLQTDNRTADESSRVRLSFEVVYGHAFKPIPRLKVGAETRISLPDMRSHLRGAPRDQKG